MKRKLLYLSFILASTFAFGQFEVRETNTDVLISDGHVLNFSEAGCSFPEPCNWKFKVTNTSAQDIFMRIFVDNMVNTDGSDFQLCFAGVCLNSVTLNSGYPSTAAIIPAGATNVAGNNLWNLNAPGTPGPMSWTFRFQAFNSLGTAIGTPVTVTYNYDENLSLQEDEFSSKIEVFPTVATNEISITSAKDLTATFYNVLGKRVKQVAVVAGEVKVDVSDLSGQVYILQLVNSEGNQTTKRIVIQ